MLGEFNISLSNKRENKASGVLSFVLQPLETAMRKHIAAVMRRDWRLRCFLLAVRDYCCRAASIIQPPFWFRSLATMCVSAEASCVAWEVVLTCSHDCVCRHTW